MPDEGPFRDLIRVGDDGAFSLPARKWRELLFIGAMRRGDDGLYVRDPDRPLPLMSEPGLFAAGHRFRAETLPDPRTGIPDALNPRRRDRGRVLLTPVSS